MLRLYLTTEGHLSELEHGEGPLHLGRNPTPAPGTVSYRINDRYVSSNQMLIEPQGGGRLGLMNLSQNVPVMLADGRTIPVGEKAEISLPARLTVGQTQIVIESTNHDEGKAVPMNTVAPPLGKASGAVAVRTLGDLYRKQSFDRQLRAPSAEMLAHWFETIVGVQRASVSTGDFQRDTARAIVDLVGLDCGFVLQREPDGWSVIARYTNDRGGEMSFSHSILRSVLEEKRTFFQLAAGDTAESLKGISAVVAAPIFDESGRHVVGALYGSRVCRLGSDDPAIRPLEAQVVQVLASAVGAGMVRLQREAEIARKRVQFEQFFSPVLARALDRDPSLLEGRDRELTILFSDIRGFSRLSENLSPRATCQLIRDVMERLTLRIRKFDGVLVDYMGDGLLAMWNAPSDQPDHAMLAVRAAMAMIEELPGLSDTWRGSIGAPLGLGIGINTGAALVGNTGSELKFKYAPLGHAVNLASRVEGATKQFGVPILITESTRQRLAGEFPTRRLGKTRLLGMARPINLYEVPPFEADDAWLARRDAYEEALKLFEANRWAEACQRLQSLISDREGHYDLPSLTLVSRAINCLKSPPENFDPVLVLETK